MRAALTTRVRPRWSVAIEAGVWLGAALLLLAQIGCFDPRRFELRAITPGVNDKLREDKGPSDRIDAPLRFFSDGTGAPDPQKPGAEKLISTFVFPTVRSEHLRSLRLSETFWLESNASPLLSYEAVVRYGEAVDAENRDDVYRVYDVGSCLTRKRDEDSPLEILVKDFRTRGKARVVGPDGNEIEDTLGVSSLWASGGLTLRRLLSGPGSTDPKSPPGVLTEGEQGVPLPEVLPSPACVMQHALDSDQDATYRLSFSLPQPIALDCSQLNSPDCTHTLFPTVKIVSDNRKLARPLSREGQSRVWSWGVDAPPASLWKENFSPNLQVDTIAIFTDDPNAPNGRRYWIPDDVEVVLDRDALTSIQCNNTMVMEDNGVQIQKLLIPECIAEGFTPTYQRAQLSQPIDDKQALRWRVKTEAQDDQRPPWGDAVLYVEFEVAKSCYPNPRVCVASGTRHLLGSPSSKDLGNVRRGLRTAFERVFRVENLGPGTVRVERVRLEGPNASELTARVASGRTFPMILPFGASFDLSLDANMQTVGEKWADVVVEYSALGAAQADTIRLPVVAHGVAPDVLVVPPIVRFQQNDASPVPSSRSIAGLLAINNGSVPFQRQQIRLGGPQAAYFVPLRSEYFSIMHIPPPATQSVDPGNSEMLWLVYLPQTPGDHAATLEIQTDAGTYTVELRGTCSGTCRYEVPAVMNTPDIGVLVLTDARAGGLTGDLKVTVDRLTPGLAGTLVSLQGTDQVPGGGGTRLCRCLEDVELNRELLSADAWRMLESLNIFNKEQAPLPGGRLEVCYRLTALGERVTNALKATSSFRSR